MGVLLHCSLCGRKQADGLLSRNYWGHLEVAPGQTLRACPTCKEAYADDWQARLTATLNGYAADGGDFRPAPDTGFGTAGL